MNLRSVIYITLLAALGSAIGFELKQHSYEPAKAPSVTFVTNNITAVPEAASAPDSGRIIPDWVCTKDKHLVIDLKTGLTCLYGSYWSLAEFRGARDD